MKILFLIDNLNTGGKERQLVELSHSLVKLNVKCEIILFNKNIFFKTILDTDIKIHKIIRKIKKDPTIFYKLMLIVKKYQPDIIHTWDDMSTIYALPISLYLKIPLINGSIRSAPNSISFFSKKYLLKKITYPFVKSVVANSKAGLRSFKVPFNKGKVIYNGININRTKGLDDISMLKNKINISTKYTIVMIGCFEPRKDYLTYLQVAKDLVNKRDDITFIAIGDGSTFNIINNMISKNESKKIMLLGSLTNVESIINMSDIGVLCSNQKKYGEGISNSIMEYMLLGKPVICTSGGGNDEIVFNNLNGWICEEGDYLGISNKIEYLIKNPKQYAKMVDESIKTIRDHFSIKIMTDNYLSLYSELLKS